MAEAVSNPDENMEFQHHEPDEVPTTVKKNALRWRRNGN